MSQNLLERYLAGVIVGEMQSHRNMTLFCLIASTEASLPASDFVTMDQALKDQSLEITEVNEGGAVPNLKVVNRSEKRVLILDGEELVGAKQNRVLNTTVLLPPNSETIIPVSCVEERRWSYRGKKFTSEERMMSAQMKRKKSETVHLSLMSEGSYDSDQYLVWSEIDEKFRRMETPRSPTSAMASIYEAHKAHASEYLRAYKPVERQVGIGCFIDGRLAGVEFVTAFGAFRELHRKLVHSYVIDALETARASIPDTEVDKRSLEDFLQRAAHSPVEVELRKSVALGRDMRIASRWVKGAGLEFEGNVLQLTLFPVEDGESPCEGGETMRSASRRRGNLRTRRFQD